MIRICGKVKFTNFDSTNQTDLSKEMSMLKDVMRGSWNLLCTFNKVTGFEKIRRQHNAREKKKKNPNNGNLVHQLRLLQKLVNILFGELVNLFFFRTHSLACPPSVPILDGKSDKAILCFQELAQIKCWNKIGHSGLNAAFGTYYYCHLQQIYKSC